MPSAPSSRTARCASRTAPSGSFIGSDAAKPRKRPRDEDEDERQRAGRLTFKLLHLADIVAVTGGLGIALEQNGRAQAPIRAVRFTVTIVAV